jgi:hypothetical protein
VDAQGRRITSDRPIPECLDREQKELNPSGTIKRSVAPPPTLAEKQAEEERQRKAQEEKARQDDDRRRARALLARYPNRATHDAERQEALRQVDEVIKMAQSRIDELHIDRKSIASEFEFYKKDPSHAPPALRQKLSDNQQAEQVQLRFIEAQADEKKRVNARFDAELNNLKLLWASPP